MNWVVIGLNWVETHQRSSILKWKLGARKCVYELNETVEGQRGGVRAVGKVEVTKLLIFVVYSGIQLDKKGLGHSLLAITEVFISLKLAFFSFSKTNFIFRCSGNNNCVWCDWSRNFWQRQVLDSWNWKILPSRRPKNTSRKQVRPRRQKISDFWRRLGTRWLIRDAVPRDVCQDCSWCGRGFLNYDKRN